MTSAGNSILFFNSLEVNLAILPAVLELFIFVTAAVVMLIFGGPMINWLIRWPGLQWSERHHHDTGKIVVPSMGGVGVYLAAVAALAGVFVVFLVLYVDSGTYAMGYRLSYADFEAGFWFWLLILPSTMLLHLGFGCYQDWLVAKSGRKLQPQIVLAVRCLFALLLIVAVQYGIMEIHPQLQAASVPDISRLSNSLPMLVLYALAVLFLLNGTCVAVDMADGIDGLATGLLVQAGIVLAIVPCLSPSENPLWFAGLWSSAIAGACLGFLAFNRSPANVLMGQAGTLALGAAFAGAAYMEKALLLLPFIGFIFCIELLGLFLPRLYAKLPRQLLSKRPPVVSGNLATRLGRTTSWSDWRVMLTFWGVNLLTSIVGLALWDLGYISRFP